MKKCSFLFIAMFACLAGFAQVQFHHGVGLGYLGNFASGSSASAIEAVYHPRITFLHKDNFSVGAGIPLGIGYQFSGDGALLVDVPTMIDVNFGHGSSDENTSTLGGYAGLGFRYVLNAGFGDNSGTASQYGPGAHAGMRFGIGEHASLGVGLNYAYDLNFDTNILGAGILYNF